MKLRCALFLAALPLLSAAETAAEAGRWRFRIYCSPCHGIRGEGGRGPDLTLGVYAAGDKDSDLFRTVASGVPGTEMGGYHHIFGDDGVKDLVAYVRSISRRDAAPPGGDPDAGGKLFWGKGACGSCHMVKGRGGRTGPDLTRVGRTRSYSHLKESVLDPNADIVAGYPEIAVTKRDGTKITGVQRGLDNFTVQLMDASEKIHSFSRDEVATVERHWRSTMPATYGKLLNERELLDLLAYLSSLGRQP